jgi:hypothetical protein
VEYVQPDNIRLLGARLLGIVPETGLVIFLYVRTLDVLAIHRSHDVGRGRLVTTGQRGEEQPTSKNRDSKTMLHKSSFDLQPEHS